MTHVPVSSRGLSSSGGTITGPLVIDLSAYGATNVEALKMLLSADWPYSGRALELLIGADRPLAVNQNGELVTGGFNSNLQGGSLDTGGGSVRVSTALGATVHTLGPTELGLFGHAAVTQQALDPPTATPEQIATVLETYGLAS